MLPAQTPGDCEQLVCDGSGGVVSQEDDGDTPTTSDPCLTGVCTGGTPSFGDVSSGTTCGAGLECDGAGHCVGCLSASDCAGTDTECQTRTCTGGTCGFKYAASGTLVSQQTPGDCKDNVCDGGGNVVSATDTNDLPSTTTQCLVPTCTGSAPSLPPAASGKACSQSGGTECDGNGNCVQCLTGSECSSLVCTGGACQSATCSDGVQNQGETGVDCGGPCSPCPTVVAVAAGSIATLGATFSPGGSWTTSALGDVSTDPPAVTVTSAGSAVGLVHSTGGSDLLMFTTWSAGTWTTLASVGAGITTRKEPAIDASGTVFDAVFQGTDFKHYYTAFDGSTWATVEAVTFGGTQSTGPTPPGIAALGANATIAFFNGNNDPNAEDRTSGAWAAEVLLSTDKSFVASPSIVRLNGGSADVMAAWIRQSDGAVMFTTRAAGTWTTPAQIPGTVAHTDASFGPIEHVALAALPSGAAILAYRDSTTGGIFYAQYAAGAWSAAPSAFSNPNVVPLAAPSLTHGVGTATAEIGFVKSDGIAYHARLIAGAWSAPAAIGGTGLSNVALTSFP